MTNSVVLPVYKEILDDNEKISFQQCLKILNRHSITLAIPKSLNVENYNSLAKRYNVILNIEKFDDCFFTGTKGYNNLMLSKEFYMRFLNYEYILIYQLDCFVFKDELDYWCSKGYDYIGSPWSLEPHLKGIPLLKKRIYNFKKRLEYRYKKMFISNFIILKIP